MSLCPAFACFCRYFAWSTERRKRAMSFPVGYPIAGLFCTGCVYCKIVWGNTGDESFRLLLGLYLNG